MAGVTFYSLCGWTQAIGNGGGFSADNFTRYVNDLSSEMKSGIFSQGHPQFFAFGKADKEVFLLDGNKIPQLKNSVLILKTKNISALGKEIYCVLGEKEFLEKLIRMEANEVVDKFVFYENLSAEGKSAIQYLLKNLQNSNNTFVSPKCLL